MFHVYEVEVDAKFSQISPEGGFNSEASARAYARLKADDYWAASLFQVVANSDIIAIYPGRGLKDPAAGEAIPIDRSAGWDDPEEGFFEEAA